MKKFTESIEESNENYMSFKNLENIIKMSEEILNMDSTKLDETFRKHDWANDHISKATESIQHVYNSLKNI